MGRGFTVLLALLIVGGAPLVSEVGDAQIEVDVETSVAEAHYEGSGLGGDASASLTPQNSTDANDSVEANASAGNPHAGVEAQPSEGEVEVSTSPAEVTVSAGDGQRVELTYTAPGPEDPVDTVQRDLPGSDEHEPVEPSAAETTADSRDEGSGRLAWTVAPIAGVAAAAAAGAVAPTPWLRRLLPGTTVAPMYSRISRDDVLDHETREAIYEELTDQPGLSLGELCERLDLARSTARHHVRKLETVGMIEHTKLGRSRVHYPVGFELEARRRHLLANDTRRAVYAALEAEPRNLTEVANALGANPGSVHFHVQKLVEAGLVEEADGKRYRTVDVADERPVERVRA